MKLAIDSLLIGVLLIVSATGTGIALMAYLRARTKKLLTLTTALSLFFGKSVILALALFWSQAKPLTDGNYLLAFDVAVVLMILFAGFWE
ncbi:MAG: hypothetical protein ACQESD_02495 [Thermoplasmatota archaeon]